MSEPPWKLPGAPDGAGECALPDPSGADAGCPVCRDQGEVGVVRAIPGAFGTARVETADGLREVAVDFAPRLARGDRVLVHLGFVVAVMDPEEDT